MPTHQTFMYCDCAQRSVLHGDRSRLRKSLVRRNRNNKGSYIAQLNWIKYRFIGVADLKYESKCRDVTPVAYGGKPSCSAGSPWYVSTRVWNHTTSFSYMDSATPIYLCPSVRQLLSPEPFGHAARTETLSRKATRCANANNGGNPNASRLLRETRTAALAPQRTQESICGSLFLWCTLQGLQTPICVFICGLIFKKFNFCKRCRWSGADNLFGK
jgi:hypothetical protein